MNTRIQWLIVQLVLLIGVSLGCDGNANSSSTQSVTIRNVSYDPTREFYQDFNLSFHDAWLAERGQNVQVEQSHGGSGKQARAVIDGLEADVVTLALAYDIDSISQRSGAIAPDWQQALPHNSSPYTSTIVFLVRKGNPKQIRDWPDLIRDGITVITPNPKTGGGARWNYLAAWGYILKRELGDLKVIQDLTQQERVQAAQAKAQDFLTDIFRRVPVLDSGARGATNTFVHREMGDVLLTWENEAFLAINEIGKDKLEIVVPSVSILAEPPVALVSKYAKKKGTEEIAKAYLLHLYSPEGQRLAAKHFYRPRNSDVLTDAQRAQFPVLELFSIDDAFGGWSEAQKRHFDDGGIFDQIYQPGK